ncbi:HAMP domain-containing sensor histidine kinase [Leptolyngbya sp. FACHB-16]|nr:HAMP domain-containing sensor histidine kinase [Leptolyngbya sp. FACHB-16]MBD1911530.1 HAMP domain-containing histidine kinase [Leptolyngbya sp. FACHB-8]MBD2155564.1 HAMP domain-containing histidine kinase [Leptolyngbya sp. FACHB-16]
MTVSELDWLLDGIETAVGRFDANGHLVQRNAAFSHMWPWLDELRIDLLYSSLLAELAIRHPEAKTEWQYIQTWMNNPQATVSLQLTLTDKTLQEWRMRPATTGGFWCLIQPLPSKKEPEELEDWGSLPHTYDLQARAAQEVVKTLNHARELSALKSRIITMLSHELRTPLTQIQSAVELLRYLELEGSEKEEIFEQVYQGIRTITNRMDDVLQVRRQQDEPAMHPQKASVDIVALCQKALGTISRESDRPIQFKSHLAIQEQHMLLDSEMMQQILHHLLSNAIKYSTADSPIWVEVEREGDRLILHVRDQGIGILAEDSPRLFDFFYRGGNIGNIPGTGLGLSILRYYLHLLTGDVTFESQPGKGSCFTISLPILP